MYPVRFDRLTPNQNGYISAKDFEQDLKERKEILNSAKRLLVDNVSDSLCGGRVSRAKELSDLRQFKTKICSISPNACIEFPWRIYFKLDLEMPTDKELLYENIIHLLCSVKNMTIFNELFL